jgi:hypothetical protein
MSMIVILFLVISCTTYASNVLSGFSITDLYQKNQYIQNVDVICDDIVPNVLFSLIKKDLNRALGHKHRWSDVNLFCAFRQTCSAWKYKIENTIDLTSYLTFLSSDTKLCRRSLLSLFFSKEFYKNMEFIECEIKGKITKIVPERFIISRAGKIIDKGFVKVGKIPKCFLVPEVTKHPTRKTSDRMRKFFHTSSLLKKIINNVYTCLFLCRYNHSPYDMSKFDYCQVELNSFFGKLKVSYDYYYYQKRDSLTSPYFQWQKGTIVVMKYDSTSDIKFSYDYIFDIFSEKMSSNNPVFRDDDSVEAVLNCLYQYYNNEDCNHQKEKPISMYVFIRNPDGSIKEQKRFK